MAIAFCTRKYGSFNVYKSGLYYEGNLGGVSYKGTSAFTIMGWWKHAIEDQSVWQAGYLWGLNKGTTGQGNWLGGGSIDRGKYTQSFAVSNNTWDYFINYNRNGNFFCAEEEAGFGPLYDSSLKPLMYDDPLFTPSFSTQWFHLAWRIEMNESAKEYTESFFINGVFVDTYTASWAFTGWPNQWVTPDVFSFGIRRVNDGDLSWNGNLAYARVFDSALTNEQIQIEKSYKSAGAVGGGGAAWGDWPLVSNLNDISGNARNLAYWPGTPQVAGIYEWDADIPSGLNSLDPSPTPTPSITTTPSVTPTITPTPSITLTPSLTLTPSVTPSLTLTPSVTPSLTPSITATPTITPTPSQSRFVISHDPIVNTDLLRRGKFYIKLEELENINARIFPLGSMCTVYYNEQTGEWETKDINTVVREQVEVVGGEY